MKSVQDYEMESHGRETELTALRRSLAAARTERDALRERIDRIARERHGLILRLVAVKRALAGRPRRGPRDAEAADLDALLKLAQRLRQARDDDAETE